MDARADPGFRHTRWFLLAYYSLFAMWGIRSAWPTVPSRLDIMVPLSLYAVASWWVVVGTDADSWVPDGHVALWFGVPQATRKSQGGLGGPLAEVWTIPSDHCIPAQDPVVRH